MGLASVQGFPITVETPLGGDVYHLAPLNGAVDVRQGRRRAIKTTCVDVGQPGPSASLAINHAETVATQSARLGITMRIRAPIN
eukprot:8194834-Alexandrium_andersonii.AAC.1